MSDGLSHIPDFNFFLGRSHRIPKVAHGGHSGQFQIKNISYIFRCAGNMNKNVGLNVTLPEAKTIHT